VNVYSDIALAKADRVCNSPADVLAQVGKSGLNGPSCNSTPDCIRELIAIDCKNTL
jgi:hypothetical protein